MSGARDAATGDREPRASGGPPEPERSVEHPLDAPLGHGRTYERWFAVVRGDASPSLAEHCADADAMGAAVAAEARRYGTSELRVGASFLLGHVAWRALGPITVAYLGSGLVPLASAATLGTTLAVPDGTPDEVRLATSAYAVSAGHAAAGHPDAVVVADDGALRAVLRRTVADVLAPLVAGLRPWARRSDRTQWRAVSDALATTLWWAGRATGADARVGAELPWILEGSAPLYGTANLVPTEEPGGRPSRVRDVCCLAYRLDAGRLCASCPLGAGA